MSNIARCKGADMCVPNLWIRGKFVDKKRLTSLPAFDYSLGSFSSILRSRSSKSCGRLRFGDFSAK